MERIKYWCCPSDPVAGVFPVRNVKKKNTHTQNKQLQRSQARVQALTVTISSDPTITFVDSHRTPNQQMKIEIFEKDEVTTSDFTWDKNI